MAVTSFSETFTSPGQRQQLVQRSQRYLGGVFMFLLFEGGSCVVRKPLGVGRFAGLVAIEKKKSDKDEACGGVGEGEGGADPSTGEGLGS